MHRLNSYFLDLLKRYEQKEQILTQHVVYETVHRAGAATFRNVVLKLNMKNFGLNYQPLFNITTESYVLKLKIVYLLNN